jgi:hypothetical protein
MPKANRKAGKTSRRRRRQAKKNQRQRATQTNRQLLKQALQRFVMPEMFADLRQHGHTRWLYDLLLRTSLMWAVSERRTWERRFEEVRRLWLEKLENCNDLTFRGFLKAVSREYEILAERLVARLRAVMFETAPQVRQVAGREVFAVDGTSLELPRTRANQEYFCGEGVDLDKKGTDRWKQTPQMHVTCLWHTRLGLPWDWRVAPGDTSERNDLREMAASLPKGALVVGDAGFVGYDLWEAVLGAGVDIVVRVGSNVHLIEDLESTGNRSDLVSYWPHDARHKDHPPRLVRLVKTELGDTEAYLVTNVLNPEDLSDADVVAIYKSRWGIELFYRGLKQTFARRRLLGRCPDSALAEVNLSLLSLWLVHLSGLEASPAIKAETPRVPSLSTIGLLDAFRDAIAHPNERPFADAALPSQLQAAHIDSYHRKLPKHSRCYPRKHQPDSCGSPVIRPAKHEERTKLESLIRNGLYQPLAV